MRLYDVQCVYVCVCSVFVAMSISVLCNNVCIHSTNHVYGSGLC